MTISVTSGVAARLREHPILKRMLNINCMSSFGTSMCRIQWSAKISKIFLDIFSV